jgi:hypothetical protein
LAGEGVVERVEGEIGKVVELSWMRSPMICEGERDYNKSDTANDVDCRSKTYSLGESLSFANEYDISLYKVGIERLNDR